MLTTGDEIRSGPAGPLSALVVGSAGGIGSAVARALVDRNAAVVGVDSSPATVEGTAHHRLDVTDLGAVDGWLRGQVHGHGSFDCLAWCVGVYDRLDLREYPPGRLREVLDVNLTALLGALGTLLDTTLAAGVPLRIAVVGSQAGVTGGRDVVYAAAKAGCVAAVKSVAREYARHGVRANVVSPGPVNTAMADVMGARRAFYEEAIPIGRFSEPSEVAEVVTWLLLDAPDAVTGTVVDVDGGLVRR